jgi:DNA repair protein RecN (Recombination protein N)
VLSSLRLRDFAIAADVEIEFGPGLTVVTGETGAGKSILIDALGLLLGGRSHERVVRLGAEAAELEARFDDVDDAEALAAAAARGIEADEGAFVVRRVIGAKSKRAWINGRMATTADLKAVVGPLVDLSTQHQANRLLERRNHLSILDRSAGLTTDLAAYRVCHASYRLLRDERDALATHLAEAAQRRDYLSYCATELDELSVTVGETTVLEAEVRRLRASEGLLDVSARALSALSDDGGARDILASLPRELERTRRDDATLADFGGRFEEIVALIEDVARDLERYADHVERDPARLERVESRMNDVLTAIRKYGGSESALFARRAAIADELAAEEDGAARLATLDRALPAAERAARTAAVALTAARLSGAATLAAAVEAVIGELGMARARFRVDVRPIDGDGLGPDGQDRVAFMLQSNVGEPAQGLVEVASGGELSRVLLGLERAASRIGGAPTAVYDEIDAGLSGSTGMSLGRFLAELGATQQLIVISHLPQVAAAADQHLHVHKAERDERTETDVTMLDDAGRLRELSRMLGAAELASDTALRHAQALIDEQRGSRLATASGEFAGRHAATAQA